MVIGEVVKNTFVSLVVVLLCVTPSLGWPAEVPSDLLALRGQIDAAVAATKQLKSAQIGFKDFRLGTSIKSDGAPKGAGSCQAAFEFSPEKMTMLSKQTVEVVRSRWLPVLDGIKTCTATTTVFEKPVVVTYLYAGDDEIMWKFSFKSANEDLPGITAAISKTLGAPKETIERSSIAQVRANTLKATREECDNERAMLAKMGNTAQPEIDKCYKSVESRTDIKMATSNLPPEGIVATQRVWLPAGAIVNYVSANTMDQTEVFFYATSMFSTVKQAVETMGNDIDKINNKSRKEEENKKAKRFLGNSHPKLQLVGSAIPVCTIKVQMRKIVTAV